MIEYIRGELAELTPAMAVVEAGGVGYGLSISLNTYTALQGRKEARLYVYEAIREDAHLLFGFSDKREREMFELLISVAGVGPNTARMILSSMSPKELCDSISSGNERLLKSVKGIGQRMAQRIIVDLRDKIAGLGFTPETEASPAAPRIADKRVRAEAIGALTMLGFAPAPSAKVVDAILEGEPDAPVEQVVKMALKQIK